MEDIGRSQKQTVKSNIRVVLWHLLKYKYQPSRQSNSWRTTIREHRNRLDEDLVDSPSLKSYFTEIFAECYQKARALAADETGLPIETFPEQSPFTLKETLNPEYLPEETEK